VKSNSSTLFWFVIKTNPRAETKVNQRLLDNGFITFFPTYTVIKIWSDRKKKVKQALISSTIFVQTTLSNLKDVYTIQGVHSILKFMGKPAIVKENEIDVLKLLSDNWNKEGITPLTNYRKGELIEVLSGPFEGRIANVLLDKSKFRLIIEIESLGSGFEIDVPKSFVKKRIKQSA